jgi:hypothetical protein
MYIYNHSPNKLTTTARFFYRIYTQIREVDEGESSSIIVYHRNHCQVNRIKQGTSSTNKPAKMTLKYRCSVNKARKGKKKATQSQIVSRPNQENSCQFSCEACTNTRLHERGRLIRGEDHGDAATATLPINDTPKRSSFLSRITGQRIGHILLRYLSQGGIGQGKKSS